MCGIAGLVDFNKTSTKQDLEKMTGTMVHRGPDGDGIFWSDQEKAQVGFGHRRLSIIDLSNNAAQPMQYKNLHLTFNGEIYNYNEIKEELVKLGHRFSTTSDTEVILHAYHEWGASMINRFVGMFAFVIFDEQRKQIIAFRDRVGVKPLFYYHHNNVWLFGSELKVLCAHPRFEKEIDVNAMSLFLQYGNVPAPHCIFRHTAKLLPGHYLVFEIETGKTSIHRYWSVYDSYNRPHIKIDLPEAIDETERIFQKAFDYRMVADVPVGVFLSGGYDSTCVTALLQKTRTEKIKTFTIGTNDTATDEAPDAKKIATHLGTDHTEYYCTHTEAKEIIPLLPYYYDEPFADSSAIPTMLVSRLAREKVTVALSADGGDEIFAGYTKYQYLLRLQQRISGLPKAARSIAHAVMQTLPVDKIPTLGNNPILSSKYQRFAGLLKDISIQNVFASASRLFTINELQKLISNRFELPATCHQSRELKNEYFDPLTYMMAMDYETYLVDDIMQKVDRASMSVSLESREPLLDQHIIDWAAVLPPYMKINEGSSKYILKQIVHKYVPKEIMERPKKGFTIPISGWMKTEFKDMVYDYLGAGYLAKQGLFNARHTQFLLNSYYSKGKLPTEKLWYLLMFQLWYDKWMKN